VFALYSCILVREACRLHCPLEMPARSWKVTEIFWRQG
jgi:hypothetical protein